MTDSDIVKALEEELKTALIINHRFEESNDTENPDDHRFIALLSRTLYLINRQKAEIERLTAENKLLIENDVSNKYPNCVLVEKGRIYTRTLEDYDELIGDISAEAYKEFAERLNKDFDEMRREYRNVLNGDGACAMIIAIKTTNNLLKELIGE